MKKIYSYLILFIVFFASCSKDELKDNQIPEENTDNFELMLDNQILQGMNTLQILKIVEKSDGYIIVDRFLVSEGPLVTGIRISKIDNQLNLVWTFQTTDNLYDIVFSGLFELPNDEHIAILKENNGSGHEVFGLKFNSSGNILWRKSYSTNNVDINTFLDQSVDFLTNGNSLKFMIVSDSTYYNENDFYFRELEINNNGNILQEKLVDFIDINQFNTIIYDYTGNKYQYGARLLPDFPGNTVYMSYDAQIIKYDINNSVLFNQTYGMKRIEDYFQKILINTNNNPILIGRYGVDPSDFTQGKWICETNLAGEIVWEIKEFEPGYMYVGKDIIQDTDGNYLSLFAEYKDGFNIATLMKSNQQGEALWKFADGTEGNTDHFTPEKIFVDNEAYLMFGINNVDKFWVKKIKHTK